MKPSSHPESTQAAPTRYAPSVPMSVYRELAAELRTNKAVIDSLNSRNEQLLKQNQRLKREIHQVVQAALTLGQAAGVARPASQNGLGTPPLSAPPYSEAKESFPNEAASDTLANLARTKGQSKRQKDESKDASSLSSSEEAPTIYEPLILPAPATPKATRHRVPRPIGESQATDRSNSERSGKKQLLKSAKNTSRQPQPNSQSESPFSAVMPKLFTEQSGDYRSSILEKSDEKEIGGIWLALSIILIIVTAFGAGFLIMKPLLNER
ncbi:MAG: hypothetical protein AAF716_02635 [Cyanobacteria bacterium P01_D01_bin.1]